MVNQMLDLPQSSSWSKIEESVRDFKDTNPVIIQAIRVWIITGFVCIFRDCFFVVLCAISNDARSHLLPPLIRCRRSTSALCSVRPSAVDCACLRQVHGLNSFLLYSIVPAKTLPVTRPRDFQSVLASKKNKKMTRIVYGETLFLFPLNFNAMMRKRNTVPIPSPLNFNTTTRKRWKQITMTDPTLWMNSIAAL